MRATITIYEDDQFHTQLTEREFLTGVWYYVSDKSGPRVRKQGREYKIVVSVPDEAEFTAVCKVPTAVPLLSGRLIPEPRNINEYTTHQGNQYYYSGMQVIPVEVSFQDPPGENYYEMFVSSSLKHKPNFVLRDELITDNVRFHGIVPNRDILEDNGKKPYYSVYFKDGDLDGQRITVTGLARAVIGPGFRNFLDRNAVYQITLRSISKDYFEHQTSREVHLFTRENSFAQPAPVYSNITNGVGIIAGYSEAHILLDFSEYF